MRPVPIRNSLQQIADAGVTLLLFTIGLEFSFHRLKKLLGSVVWAVTTQILLTILVCYFLFLWLGFGLLAVFVYCNCRVAFLNGNYCKNSCPSAESLETVPGELSTAWFVIQDLSVVPIMIILPALIAVQTCRQIVMFCQVVGAVFV